MDGVSVAKLVLLARAKRQRESLLTSPEGPWV
jgi:hypothetical protein